MKLSPAELNTIENGMQRRMSLIMKSENLNDTAVLKQVTKTNIILKKLHYQEKLSPLQKAFLCSVLKSEIQESYEDFIKSIYSSTDLELLALITTDTEKLEKLYQIEILYNKINKNAEAIKLTSDYLQVYYQLSNLPYSKIYYSISNDKIYKVGIPINQKQIVKIELDSNENCTPFTIGKIAQSTDSYMHIGTNETVYALLKKYEQNNPLKSRMSFIKKILQQKIS